MAELKNLIVSGNSRLIGDTNAAKVTATQFIKSGGTSSQFLKADGSVDGNTYALNSSLAWNKTQQGGAILADSGTTASASGAIAYGEANISDIIASGTGSQAGGYSDEHGLIKAQGNGSRAMGVTQLEGHIIASGHASEAIGYVDSDISEIVASERGACARGLAQDGHITASGAGSQAEGYAYGGLMQASGYGSAARGCAVNEGGILSSGAGSFANGYSTSQGAIQATQQGAFASGYTNNATITASNKGAFATGYSDGDNSITASGLGSIAHGYTDGGSGNIKATGKGSHAEGTSTTAIGDYSHAEGDSTVAYGTGSKSEGTRTSSITISGVSGSGTSYTSSNANKLYKGALLNSGLTYARVVSISGNSFTVNNTLGSMSSDYVLMIRGCASGVYSHSEGSGSAYGDFSHAEGSETIASEIGSHAEGVGTIAQNLAEHAEGRYNKSNKVSTAWDDTGNTLHSIGIGTGPSARVNAVEVMQNGDVYIKGIGGYNGTNPGASGVKSVQTVISELTTALSSLEQVLASI